MGQNKKFSFLGTKKSKLEVNSFIIYMKSHSRVWIKIWAVFYFSPRWWFEFFLKYVIWFLWRQQIKFSTIFLNFLIFFFLIFCQFYFIFLIFFLHYFYFLFVVFFDFSFSLYLIAPRINKDRRKGFGLISKLIATWAVFLSKSSFSWCSLLESGAARLRLWFTVNGSELFIAPD